MPVYNNIIIHTPRVNYVYYLHDASTRSSRVGGGGSSSYLRERSCRTLHVRRDRNKRANDFRTNLPVYATPRNGLWALAQLVGTRFMPASLHHRFVTVLTDKRQPFLMFTFIVDSSNNVVSTRH